MHVVLSLLLGHICLCARAAFVMESSHNTMTKTPSYNWALDNGSQGSYPTHRYITEDSITSPVVNFATWHPDCENDLYTLITPRGAAVVRAAPMLLDQRGNLVWTRSFNNKYGGQAYGLDVQTYQGQEYLTFWIGDDRVKGHGSGSYYMLDTSYNIAYEIEALNDLDADLHEFHITPEGTALLTIYQVIEYHSRDLHKSSSANQLEPLFIWDCLFQEITIKSRELIFQWRASDHVALTDSYREVVGGSQEDPYDYFHMNSIEKDHHGNYLISARYPQSIYYVDGKSGDIIWVLGGKGNIFSDLSEGSAISFAWQHDARLHALDAIPEIYQPIGERKGVEVVLISMFDNAAEDYRYDYGVGYSRGLLLELTFPEISHRETTQRHPQRYSASNYDETADVNLQKIADINGTNQAHTVRVIQSYANPQLIRSSSQGSMQVIPRTRTGNASVIVGYGLNAAWTEFNTDGAVICDVHFAARTTWESGDVQSYRTRKASWVGRPKSTPAVAITDDGMWLYVSWNGATEVNQWVLQASVGYASNEVWNEVHRLPKSSFETAFGLTTHSDHDRYFRIVALDRSGQPLDHGTSRVLDRQAKEMASAVLTGLTSDKVAGFETLVISISVLTLGVCIFLAWYSAGPHASNHHYGRDSPGVLMWQKGVAYARLRAGSG